MRPAVARPSDHLRRLRRRRAAAWIAAVGWAAATVAQAQPVSMPQLQVLARAQRDAERAYTVLLATPPAPSVTLLEARREADELTEAIAQNYALRDGYATGRIPAPPGEADRDAWRARVSGLISNTIAEQQRTLRALTAEIARLGRAELVRPVDDARERALAASRALDDALQRFAAAQGPPIVASVALLDDAGAPRFVGTWRWTDEAATQRRVVEALEATLAGLATDLAALQAQNLSLAEDLHAATRAWNAALETVLARAEVRAFRDLFVQAVQNGVEIGFAVATAGTWTAARVVYTVADVALRAPASYRVADGLATAATDAERDHLGAELRDAIAERVAADLAAGRRLDPERLLDGREPLPTTPSVAVPVGALTLEGAKTAVAALIAYVETGAERARPIDADRLPAAVLALSRGVPADGLLEAAAALRAEREALAAATSELRGLGVSLASMAGAARFVYLFDLFLTYREPSDAELARALALGELRIFLLSEAYRQSRALYDAKVVLERAVREALPAARQSLAAAGRRAFADGAGQVVDRAAAARVVAPSGPLAVRVELDGAPVAWRVDVWHEAGDGRELLASVRAPAGVRVATTPPIPRDRLPADVAVGPPTSLVVQVASALPGDRDVDGDPATPAWLDPVALAWQGWEPGPDAYRFHVVTTVPPCGSVAIAEQGTLCRCAPGTSVGDVWGSDLYATDSAICTAAVHAGALPGSVAADGTLAVDGVVEVRRARGCAPYRGSTRNGVTTLGYSGWPDSFYFPAVQSGVCEEGNPPPDGAWYCPRTGDGLTADRVRCQCTSDATQVDYAWGTSVYTSDSVVCRAALHAGVVGPAGGTVDVIVLPGREAYEGSERNGVTSYGYGGWPSSFGFR